MNKISFFLSAFLFLTTAHAGLKIELQQRDEPYGPVTWSYTLELSDAEAAQLAHQAHQEIYHFSPVEFLTEIRTRVLNQEALTEIEFLEKARIQLNNATQTEKAKYACLFDSQLVVVIQQMMLHNLPHADAIEKFRAGTLEEDSFRLQMGKRAFLTEMINGFISEMGDIVGQAAVQAVEDLKMDVFHRPYKLTPFEKDQIKNDLQPMPSATEFFTHMRNQTLAGNTAIWADLLQDYPDAAQINKFSSLLSELLRSQSNDQSKLEYEIDQCVLEFFKFNLSKQRQSYEAQKKRLQGIRALAILNDNDDPKAFAAQCYWLEESFKHYEQFISSLAEDLNKRSKKKAGLLRRFAQAIGFAK